MNEILNKLEKLKDTVGNKDLIVIKEIEDTIRQSVNLCDMCKFQYPACMGNITEWGTGIGKDNVVGCQSYERRTTNLKK